MEGPPGKIEFAVVRQPEKLAEFYENVLGYRAITQDSDSGEWSVLIRKVSKTGEISDEEVTTRDVKTDLSPYIGTFPVEDIDETIRLALDNGGSIYSEEDPDPIRSISLGRQVFLCDPEGNMFGVVELRREPQI